MRAKTIRDLIKIGTTELVSISSTARLDSEILLTVTLNCSRTYLIANSNRLISTEQQDKFLQLLNRRKCSEPVAYITGKKEFFGLEFFVTPEVLIPRPETELIVEKALNFIRSYSGLIRVLDLGTGSGCIPISIARNLNEEEKKRVYLIALDKSDEAIKIAKINAENHQVSDAIEFKNSDWFSAIDGSQPFDLILANPPYGTKEERDESLGLKFEPQSAFVAGMNGLEDIETIISGLPLYLRELGKFILEHGYDQSEAVHIIAQKYLQSNIWKNEIYCDLAGLHRGIEITRLAC